MPQRSWRRPALACALGLLAFVLAGDPVPKLETAPRFAARRRVRPGFVHRPRNGPGPADRPLLRGPPALGCPDPGDARAPARPPPTRPKPGAPPCSTAASGASCSPSPSTGSPPASSSTSGCSGRASPCPADALLLLFVHQFMGGLVNGLVAEALLRVPVLRSLLPARDDLRAMSLEQYVFSRVVFVATIPALVLALLFTRTAYDGALARSERRTVARLQEAQARLRADLSRSAARRCSGWPGSSRWTGTRPAPATSRCWPCSRRPPASTSSSSCRPRVACSPDLQGGSPLAETALGADLGRPALVPGGPRPHRPRGLAPLPGREEPGARGDPGRAPPARRRQASGRARRDPRPTHPRPGLPEGGDAPQAEHVTVLDPHHLVLATRRPDLRTGDSLRGILAPSLTEAAAATPFAFEPGGDARASPRPSGLETRRRGLRAASALGLRRPRGPARPGDADASSCRWRDASSPSSPACWAFSTRGGALRTAGSPGRSWPWTTRAAPSPRAASRRRPPSAGSSEARSPRSARWPSASWPCATRWPTRTP